MSVATEISANYNKTKVPPAVAIPSSALTNDSPPTITGTKDLPPTINSNPCALDAVQLGLAYTFGVFATQAVNSAGTTTVRGDIGVPPGTSVTGFPPGTHTGTMETTGKAAAVKNDLTVAYNDAKGRMLCPITVAGDLGGRTLAPGLYKSTTSLSLGSGNLTLDGEGDSDAVFIFQVGGTLNLAVATSIELINGAQAQNVFWQLDTSGTLGSRSSFVGTLMAGTSINVGPRSVIHGRLFALNGSVTLESNYLTTPSLITNFNDETKFYFDGSYTITAPTSSSTGAFTYTSGNTAIATINGTTVTIKGAGTASITATQAADDTHNSGGTTATLTVNSVSVLTKNGQFSATNPNYVDRNGKIGGDFGVDKNGNRVAVKTPVFYLDADNDGYGDINSSIDAATAPTGYVDNNTDCDDNNPSINPGAEEIFTDDIDNNCDGVKTVLVPCDNCQSGSGSYFDDSDRRAGRNCSDNPEEGYSPCTTQIYTVVIGDAFQGGIVAYILQAGDPGYISGETHGLIAATLDQSTGISWKNGVNMATNALGTAIGTGLANTNTIINSQGPTAINYAAGLARAYDGGSNTDWYLPSVDELYILWQNRTTIGNFSDSNQYWSSTDSQYNDTGRSVLISFSNGERDEIDKGRACRVRAVRAF